MPPLLKQHNNIDVDFYDDDSSTDQSIDRPAASLSPPLVSKSALKVQRQAPTKSSKKTVTISKYSLQYTIPSIDEYSDKELNGMHMTVADHQRIRLENELTLHAMQDAGDLPNTDQSYFRGLESYLAKQSMERRQRVWLGISAVLGEQARVRNQAARAGLPATSVAIDPKRIQRFNSQLAHESSKRAHWAACWDAQQLAEAHEVES